VSRKVDQLLDEPLLSAEEIGSWVTDIRAMQEGRIQGMVGSQFWERATTEMARRQAKAQIRAANALVRWTVILAIFTGLLVAVTVAQLYIRR